MRTIYPSIMYISFLSLFPVTLLTTSYYVSPSPSSVHSMEATERPHQQLGTVGVDTGTGVLVADGHLPTACQWLSQVRKILFVQVAYVRCTIFCCSYFIYTKYVRCITHFIRFITGILPLYICYIPYSRFHSQEKSFREFSISLAICRNSP